VKPYLVIVCQLASRLKKNPVVRHLPRISTDFPKPSASCANERCLKVVK
jgi:hypothetical protein